MKGSVWIASLATLMSALSAVGVAQGKKSELKAAGCANLAGG